MVGAMAKMRQRTRQILRFLRLQPLKGKRLSCPKCGHELGWHMQKDEEVPDKKSVIFRCFQCHLVDTIVKTGKAFEIIDFYCELCDHFFEAIKQQTVTIIEEKATPLAVNTLKLSQDQDRQEHQQTDYIDY